MSHRDRLVRFYEKYNPAKVGSVDKALESYAGREDEMFEALVSKYGPEPAAAAAAGSGTDYRSRLIAFYEKYNPAKVSSVDKALEAYAGREDEMFEALVSKYGPEPGAAASPAAPASPKAGGGGGGTDYRARLVAFYEKYNPAKVGSVDKALEAYAGREEEMFEALVSKYGAEPGGAASAAPAAAAGSGGDYRGRLIAFYEKYNPAKVSSVDKALEAYAGREDEMFEALVGKYGPEPAGAASAASTPKTGSVDYRSRLIAFYEKYKPEKVGSVDKALEAYAGREEEMFEALVSKYGAEPSGAAASPAAAAPPKAAPASGGGADYRTRLVAFYEKYNPAKVSSVDKALEAYAGREEEMFEALTSKYGPEPAAGGGGSTASTPNTGATDYRGRLVAFYEKYNPAKVGSVDKALEAYAGREEEMFEALVSKYGAEPTAAAPAASAPVKAAPAATDYRARLVAFYEKYKPEKVGSVDKALEAYAGREEEMFEALVSKYGAEPGGAASAAPASAAAGSGGDYRARLVAFYEKYNPAKVSSVDKALEAYAGREEEMFEALTSKYGPEPGGAASATSTPKTGPADYRSRLIAFYEKYNPAKVGSVDKALEAYAGREEEMFEALVSKYGAEPTAAAPAAPASAKAAPAAIDYRARLVAFYEKYNPGKVSSVDKALEAYAGREDEMFEALVGKYGPEPAAAAAAAGNGGDYRSRLIAFYEKYNPAKVSSVDKALEAYAGREDEMFEALVGKYGPEPAAAAAAAPTPAAAAAPAPAAGGYAARLTAFYEKYVPNKVDSVQKTLGKYEGREEELFEALVGKYGPEPGGAAPAAPSGDYRARLVALYEKYAPNKLPGVDKALATYEGREDEMFEALVAKYGPEPAAAAAPVAAATAAAPAAAGGHAARLTAFYEKYAPNKVDSVEKTLGKYEGREEELFEALVGKYGPEPAGATPAPAAATTPAAGVGSSSYANRLAAFYEKYAPNKVASVATTLAKYEGREEDLFEALVGKYGPEPEAPVTAKVAAADTEVPRGAAKEEDDSAAQGDASPEVVEKSGGGECAPSQASEDPAEVRLAQLMKEEGVASDDEAQIRLLKRLIQAELAGPSTEAYTAGGAAGSPGGRSGSPKDLKHLKAHQLSPAGQRDLMESDENVARMSIEDLAMDEVAIEGHHFEHTKNVMLTRQAMATFLNNNTQALRKRYLGIWQLGAVAIKKAKRLAAVESMTNYQRMQLTPSAKTYYSRMEEMERQQQIKQEQTRRRQQEERDSRIRACFDRGDFISRNIEEASQSPKREANKSGSPKASSMFHLSPSQRDAKNGGGNSSSNKNDSSNSVRRQKSHSAARELSNKKQRGKTEATAQRQKLENNFAMMPQERQIALLRRLKKQGLPVPFDLQRALEKSAMVHGRDEDGYDQEGGNQFYQDPNDITSPTYSNNRHAMEDSRADGLFASPIVRLGGRSPDNNGSPNHQQMSNRSGGGGQWPNQQAELEEYMRQVLAEAEAEESAQQQ